MASNRSVWLRWLAAALCCIVALLYCRAYLRSEYEPVQPVPFVHDTHTRADKVGMPCQACHAGADRGVHAGIPSAASCMDCHRHILAQDERLLPLHVAADADFAAYTGDPLRWRRSAPLPAYAHFHHGVHAAKYECERCHPSPGCEAAMHMRDCLECHRDESLPTDCTQCHH